MRDNNHLITSLDIEKAFDKTQHAFSIKRLNKLGIEGTKLNIIQGIYNKTIANFILSS
jgi:hypothetical protein